MATTIFTQPEVIQPVYGNLVYEFSATTQATKYKFRYVAEVYVEDTLIGTFKITPQFPTHARLDIAEILRNYINSRPINDGCSGTTETPIVQAEWGYLADDIHDYYVIIKTEYSDNPVDAPVIAGPIVTGDTAYAYNGVKNWYDGKSFDMGEYLLSNLSVPSNVPADHHKFLTKAPRVQYIGSNDWSTLSGINTRLPLYDGSTYDDYSQPVYSMTVEFYDVDDVLLSTEKTYNLTGSCGSFISGADITGQTTDFQRSNIIYAGTGPKNLENNGFTGTSTNWHYYRVYFNGYVPVCITATITNTTIGVLSFTYANCNNVPINLNVDSGASTEICYRGFISPPDGIIVERTGYCQELVETEYMSDERISEYFYYYRDPECGPGSQRVMWLNSLGTYDYFTFKGRDTVGYDMNRQSFEKVADSVTTLWSEDKYYGWNNQTQVYNQTVTKSGILYSGRISKSYLSWITEELLKSPSVYLVDADGDIQPIVLTNTEVVEPNFQRNDGVYEINLEYIGGYNENRQIKQ